jgi:hypothetical protein
VQSEITDYIAQFLPPAETTSRAAVAVAVAAAAAAAAVAAEEQSTLCEQADIPREGLWVWVDDSAHSLPEEWSFPKVSLFTGWQLWLRGNKQRTGPPFRLLSSKDCATRDTAKRPSDRRAVYSLLESNLSDPSHGRASCAREYGGLHLTRDLPSSTGGGNGALQVQSPQSSVSCTW